MSPFQKVVTNKYFATIITLVLAYLLTKVGYAEIWPLFGSANQLLSVLALVACAVFLKKTKRKGLSLIHIYFRRRLYLRGWRIHNFSSFRLSYSSW